MIDTKSLISDLADKIFSVDLTDTENVSLLEAKASVEKEKIMDTEQVINQTQNDGAENQEDSSTSKETQVDSSQQQDANKSADLQETKKEPSQENIIGELRRKLDEVPMLIQQAVMAAQARPNVQQQQVPITQDEPKYKGYTSSQLENVLNHPQATPQDIAFATRGLAYLETKQDLMTEMRSENEKTQAQSRQVQALQGIVKDYPELYKNGQWDYSNPLFQRAMQIHQSDPRLLQAGNEGLYVACDRAYAQMAREGQLNLKKKEIKLNSKERSEIKSQSQSMQAGSQASPQGGATKATTVQKLMEAYKKSPEGSREQAELRTQLFKAKGLIPSS